MVLGGMRWCVMVPLNGSANYGGDPGMSGVEHSFQSLLYPLVWTATAVLGLRNRGGWEKLKAGTSHYQRDRAWSA
jgi:hypothetical protein